MLFVHVLLDLGEKISALLQYAVQHAEQLFVRDRRTFADERKIPTWRWKIFETSGTVPGQSTAFGLIGHGSYLAVVGYTPDRVELRLSNLMAFDATAQGNWGCAPERYPAILDLVLKGTIALKPFVEHRPAINDVFADLHARRVSRRVVLIPER